MTLDKNLYREFIESLELEDIYLSSLEVKILSEPKSEDLSVDLEPTFDINNACEGTLETKARFKVSVTNGETPIFIIDVEFTLLYTYSPDITINEAIQERFVQTTLPVNSWPYAREIISTMTSRMGFPSLIIHPFKIY